MKKWSLEIERQSFRLLMCPHCLVLQALSLDGDKEGGEERQKEKCKKDRGGAVC